MNTQRLGLNSLGSAVAMFSLIACWATNVQAVKEISSTRTAMSGEGYLAYQQTAINPTTSRFGEEWTGWVDIRHPSLAGTADTTLGFDRSDRVLNINSTVVTDNAGTVGFNNRPVDFNFANKAYMLQAGVMPLETGTQNVTANGVGGQPNVTFPVTTGTRVAIVNANTTGGSTIDLYYMDLGSNGFLGVTRFPSGAPPHIVVDNQQTAPSRGFPDTFAHELYHFVGDGQPIHSQFVGEFLDFGADGIQAGSLGGGLPAADAGEGDMMFTPGEPTNDFGGDGVNNTNDFSEGDGSFVGADRGHSSQQRNIIASGVAQWSPGMASGFNPNGVGNLGPVPPWAIANSLNVIGPPMSTTNSMANGPPRVGGINQLTSNQAQRIFAAGATGQPFNTYFPNAQKVDNNNAGHRVDFDFVVDHRQQGLDHDGDGSPNTGNVNFGLEGLTNGADNHRGADALFWGVGATAASPQPAPTANNGGKNKTGLGTFGNLQDLSATGATTFRFVDVVSINARYSDSDITGNIGGNGNLSPKEAALDYTVMFVDALGNTAPGVAIETYIQGWTTNTTAENFLTRWKAPFQATGLSVQAQVAQGHDGTAQIDAVIAANKLSAPVGTGGISFSLNRNAEGLEFPLNGANPGAPNDAYVLGLAPPIAGSTGGHGLATEGEIFTNREIISGGSGFVDTDPNGTNIDRISGALGNVPRLGPHVAPPAAQPSTGAGVMGLAPGDNIMGLSYGKDSGSVLYFSVDPNSAGVANSDVQFESVLSPAAGAAALPFPANPGGGSPGQEAAGDIFASSKISGFGSFLNLHHQNHKEAPRIAAQNDNLLVFDERLLGLQAPATNGAGLGPPEDDLSALEMASPSDRNFGVDFNLTGVLEPTDGAIWFSLDSLSPSNGLLTTSVGGGIINLSPNADPAVSPDDILVTPPGIGEDVNGDGILNDGVAGPLLNEILDGLDYNDDGVLGGLFNEDFNGDGLLDPFTFALYASGVDIGLIADDQIDALAISDFQFTDPTGEKLLRLDVGIDQALFSLAPGSPSLAALGASAADVFFTDFTGAFSLFASAAQLGLLATDNLDALDILPVPEPSGALLAIVALLCGVSRLRLSDP